MGYSGAILKNGNGRILFQLRDEKGRNPNKWGIFGGGIRKNEISFFQTGFESGRMEARTIFRSYPRSDQLVYFDGHDGPFFFDAHCCGSIHYHF